MFLKVKLNGDVVLVPEKRFIKVTELPEFVQRTVAAVLLQPECTNAWPLVASLQFEGNVIIREPEEGKGILELGVIVMR